jgi:hypothetical protein
MISQGSFRSVIFLAQVRDPAASLTTSTLGFSLLKASAICLKGRDKEPAWKMITLSWAPASDGKTRKAMKEKFISRTTTLFLDILLTVPQCASSL